MKRSAILILALALLAGCADSTVSQQGQTSQTTTYAPVTTAQTTAASTTTAATKITTTATTTTEPQTQSDLPEEHIPVPSSEPLVNDDGTLTEAFLHNLEEMRLAYLPSAYGMGIYPALYDFDEDGVPELIMIMSSGGQGEMPCKVHDPNTLELIGEFSGYCRDGYTRFSQMDGKTVIHDYWEHSNWQRSESFSIAEITDNGFEITEHYYSYGQLNIGEVQPTMNVGCTDNYLELEKSGFSFEFMGDNVSRFAEEYDISTYGYWDTMYHDRFELVFDLYNDYIETRNTVNTESPDIASIADFDGDGRHEAFYISFSEGAYFLGADGERSLLWEEQGINTVYRLWTNYIVLQPYGNSSDCRVYRVIDGEPQLIETVSDKGMYFDYSDLYNGCFQLIDSKYELSHTFKDYQFELDYSTGEIFEYGSIPITVDEFITAYGEGAQRFLDKIESENGTVTDLLFRGDNVVIINYTVPVTEESCKTKYLLLKLSFYKDIVLTELSSGSGRYEAAIAPEIAVYPEEIYIPEWVEE